MIALEPTSPGAAEIAWALYPSTATCLAVDPAPGGPAAWVLAVAESVGEGSTGELVLDTLARQARRLEAGRPRRWLRDALAAAGRAARERGGLATATVLVLDGGRAVLGHAGDGRALLYRDGVLEQCTADHTRAAELVRLRRITPEQALAHPARGLLTHGLGARRGPAPDIVSRDLRAGDRWVVCNARLAGALRREAIAEVVRRRRSPVEAAARLGEAAGAGAAVVVAAAVSPEDRR